jgi:hypothetical protein
MAKSVHDFAFANGAPGGVDGGPVVRDLGFDEDDQRVPVGDYQKKKNAASFHEHWVQGEVARAHTLGLNETYAAHAANADHVYQGSMFPKQSLHYFMSTVDDTLPSYALDLRLNHYSGRSVLECERKAALASGGHDIFGSGGIRTDRCKRADFLDNVTKTDPDTSLSKYGQLIRIAMETYFGEAAAATLQSETSWYRKKLQAFKAGGSADF